MSNLRPTILVIMKLDVQIKHTRCSVTFRRQSCKVQNYEYHQQQQLHGKPLPYPGQEEVTLFRE